MKPLHCLSLALLIHGCGSEKKSAAASKADTGWCGVETVSLVNYPGISRLKGWSTSLPVPLAFSNEFSASELEQIHAALDTWEKAAGMTLFSRSSEPAAQTGASFPTLDAPLEAATNLYVKDKTWTTHTGKVAGILGTTVSTTSDSDSEIIERAAVRFNYEHWVYGDAAVLKEKNSVDLQSVTLHEMGHFLGLGHAEDKKSVMTPEVLIGPNVMARKLWKADVETIRIIYTGGDAAGDDFPYADP